MQIRPSTRAVTPEAGQELAGSFALAAVVIGRVLEGDSLTGAMAQLRATGARRSAVQDLAFSALREYGLFDAVLDRLISRPPAASLRGLLMAALLEIERGVQTQHAIVHQAVEAAGRVAPRGGTSAKGLVNAVLRNYLRQRDALLAELQSSEWVRYGHPQWWITRLQQAWPHDWEAVLLSGNKAPGLTLRINARRTDAVSYLPRLAAAGFAGRQLGSHAVRLEKPVPVHKLPGFQEGEVSIQDWGAQQAALLLDVRPGQCVWDACAAPGGKATHILELVDCDLTASDIDPRRLERVTENLTRLGLAAQIATADALGKGGARDRLFDRILADVPCSASGVVRRHPDIKWLRRESDIAAFAATQEAMLDALWPRLAPGGKLLYATCSLFPEENSEQVQRFMKRHPDAALLPLAGPAALGRVSGQILPGEDSDGFFYALFGKLP
jgi:16S rRNA (cytosine967-C5)-methyltransferase